MRQRNATSDLINDGEIINALIVNLEQKIAQMATKLNRNEHEVTSINQRFDNSTKLVE